MPAMLVTILIAFASSLGARILLGLGLAIYVNSKIDELVADAQAAMLSLWGTLPSDIMGVLGILNIPQALGVIMSAIGIAAFIKSSKIFLGRA